MPNAPSDAITSLDVLLTAGEAFPVFEGHFLQAKREIWCGFRVFDLDTKLRSDAAREIGETWFDLFEHTLSRGVDITMVLSDFDPVVATDYHRKSWKSARQLAAVEAVSGRGRMTFRIARHPAKVGLIPRLFLRRKVREKFEAAQMDRDTPGLQELSPSDIFQLSPVTHHQKLAVFDRETLYVGGLDLNERRFDTPDHAREAEQTWQDVQVVVTGPVVDAAQKHLETFEDATARKSKPAAVADGLLRTLSARRRPALFHISPRTLVTEIEQAHLDAIASAEGLIYLETQFLRHLPLAEALGKAGKTRQSLHLIVVLPAAPEDVAFENNDGRDAKMGEQLQADCITQLRDGFGDRVQLCSPARRVQADDGSDRDSSHGSPIIYVHSKVSIFDDREAIVSSANLNGRSLRWDTEVGVRLTRPDHVQQLKTRILGHWMPSMTTQRGVPADLFRHWQHTVQNDADRSPDCRTSRLVPYDVRPAKDIGEHIPYMPNELV